MSRRAIIALSSAMMALTPVDPGLAQQAARDLLPPPSAPGSLAAHKQFQIGSQQAGTAVRLGRAANSSKAPIHDGWGGYAIQPIERAPLVAPAPEIAPVETGNADASSLNKLLDGVQDLLTDQEDARPDAVEQGEKLDWNQIDQVLVDGDFADSNSAEKQVGWIASDRRSNPPKLRRPTIDLKEMTRLKLNPSGSTVFDITKGAVVTKF